MADFGKLMSGYRTFKATTYYEQKDVIGHLLRQGIKAKTLFITCSDMRISPDKIFSGNTGDYFVFRNMAALIPSYQVGNANGIVAAIEYAVQILEVENIIVLGHSHCDSIKLLMGNHEADDPTARIVKNSLAIKPWLAIAEEAKDAVNEGLPDRTAEEKERACEQESILVSLKNLLSYPFVEERLQDDRIKLYGWHFCIEDGELKGFNPETKFFELLG